MGFDPMVFLDFFSNLSCCILRRHIIDDNIGSFGGKFIGYYSTQSSELMSIAAETLWL